MGDRSIHANLISALASLKWLAGIPVAGKFLHRRIARRKPVPRIPQPSARHAVSHRLQPRCRVASICRRQRAGRLGRCQRMADGRGACRSSVDEFGRSGVLHRDGVRAGVVSQEAAAYGRRIRGAISSRMSLRAKDRSPWTLRCGTHLLDGLPRAVIGRLGKTRHENAVPRFAEIRSLDSH